jgi:oxygen-independent coproporphyrinogen-3 oxidase
LSLEADYLRALRADIERAALPPASSVFVGGGTPSMVDPAALVGVIGSIPLRSGAEVTVECNPDDVTPELVAAYVAGGVNRISLGVQSMVPHVLESLGRWHDRSAVTRAVSWVRSGGIGSFNVDLIYGAAGESLADWQTTLDGALALHPSHVSAYALTVESGTRLALQRHRHPDDDDLADKYELADEHLGAAGLHNYEVSNWARPGHESAHNRLYWMQGDYRGFGCAAHSHAAGRRWWNVRTPEKYLESVKFRRSTEAGFEELTDEERRIEGLQLAMRMREGVPADALNLEQLDGLVDLVDGRAVLTQRGRLMANEVAMHLR